MEQQMVKELLLQSLEHEIGGTKVYQTALKCVVNEDWQRVRAVLKALPERDRRCVYLRAEGRRYREIANVLGMSLGGVAKSLTRAIARLSAGVGT